MFGSFSNKVISLKVFLGAFLILAASLLFTLSAQAADTISTATYLDTDADGTVDIIRWVMDENVTACAYEAGDWTVNTASEMNVTITGLTCTGSDANLDIDVSVDANETGAATDPVVSYANAGTAGSVTLTSGAMTAKANQTISDAAAPVVVSVSPTDAATSVSKTANIVLTFSEAMTATFDEGTEFSVSPDPGGFTDTWSSGNTVVTLDPPNFACGVTYSVTTTEAEITASSGSSTTLVTTGPSDGDWSFTTVSSGCSSSGGTETAETVPNDISLTDLADVTAGEKVSIRWTVDGDGITYANLYYSTNGGDSFVVIEKNIVASTSGSYSWTVPAGLETDHAMIRIEGTDLALVLDSDVTNEFSIYPPEEEAVSEEEGSEESVTEVVGVTPGDIVMSLESSTLYYVTDEYERRVFMNEQSYFTWFNDFEDVRIISASTLADLPLVGVMLPKAGTVLVKIQSDPRVYALTEGASEFDVHLNEIASESVAKDLYGSDWADYVIDIEPTFFTKFADGNVVDEVGDIEVSVGVMKKRTELVL